MRNLGMIGPVVALATSVFGCSGDDDVADTGGATTGVSGSTGATTSATTATTATTTMTDTTATTATSSVTNDTGEPTTTTAAETTGTATTGVDTSAGTTGQGSPYVPCDASMPCAGDGLCWTNGEMPPASVCGEPCVDPSDCSVPSSGTANPVCVENTLDPGMHNCILNCDGLVCPDGMECMPLGNSQYCFWPA